VYSPHLRGQKRYLGIGGVCWEWDEEGSGNRGISISKSFPRCPIPSPDHLANPIFHPFIHSLLNLFRCASWIFWLPGSRCKSRSLVVLSLGWSGTGGDWWTLNGFEHAEQLNRLMTVHCMQHELRSCWSLCAFNAPFPLFWQILSSTDPYVHFYVYLYLHQPHIPSSLSPLPRPSPSTSPITIHIPHHHPHPSSPSTSTIAIPPSPSMAEQSRRGYWMRQVG